MSRHRNFRNYDYGDDMCEDVYGHSVDDAEFALSPHTEAQFLYRRSDSHEPTLSAFIEEPYNEEGSEESEEDDTLVNSHDYKRPQLDPVSEAKLLSCLDQLRSILGDDCHEETAVSAVIENNYDVEQALDQILNKKEKKSAKKSAGRAQKDVVRLETNSVLTKLKQCDKNTPNLPEKLDSLSLRSPDHKSQAARANAKKIEKLVSVDEAAVKTGVKPVTDLKSILGKTNVGGPKMQARRNQLNKADLSKSLSAIAKSTRKDAPKNVMQDASTHKTDVTTAGLANSVAFGAMPSLSEFLSNVPNKDNRAQGLSGTSGLASIPSLSSFMTDVPNKDGVPNKDNRTQGLSATSGLASIPLLSSFMTDVPNKDGVPNKDNRAQGLSGTSGLASIPSLSSFMADVPNKDGFPNKDSVPKIDNNAPGSSKMAAFGSVPSLSSFLSSVPKTDNQMTGTLPAAGHAVPSLSSFLTSVPNSDDTPKVHGTPEASNISLNSIPSLNTFMHGVSSTDRSNTSIPDSSHPPEKLDMSLSPLPLSAFLQDVPKINSSQTSVAAKEINSEAIPSLSSFLGGIPKMGSPKVGSTFPPGLGLTSLSTAPPLSSYVPGARPCTIPLPSETSASKQQPTENLPMSPTSSLSLLMKQHSNACPISLQSATSIPKSDGAPILKSNMVHVPKSNDTPIPKSDHMPVPNSDGALVPKSDANLKSAQNLTNGTVESMDIDAENSPPKRTDCRGRRRRREKVKPSLFASILCMDYRTDRKRIKLIEDKLSEGVVLNLLKDDGEGGACVPFKFDTLSPDDIVLAKQKDAFTRR